LKNERPIHSAHVRTIDGEKNWMISAEKEEKPKKGRKKNTEKKCIISWGDGGGMKKEVMFFESMYR
jgi:hypothetical protein